MVCGCLKKKKKKIGVPSDDICDGFGGNDEEKEQEGRTVS